MFVLASESQLFIAIRSKYLVLRTSTVANLHFPPICFSDGCMGDIDARETELPIAIQRITTLWLSVVVRGRVTNALIFGVEGEKA
jgi:hypothetical protein